MTRHEKYTNLIRWHQAIDNFDYDQTIDWAIELIKQGKETENILILASFSKPVDAYHIRPYVSAVLRDLNLTEKYGKYSTIAIAHFHLDQILASQQLKKNLNALYNLHQNTNQEFGLTPFYLLYHAWSRLEEDGFNPYFEGANLENIEQVLKEQALLWLNQFVFN